MEPVIKNSVHQNIQPGVINVQLYQDYKLFNQVCGDFMKADPLSTNVIGVQLEGVISGTRPHNSDDVYISLSTQAKVIGVAMHTPPYNLFLSQMPPAAPTVLASYLHDSMHLVPGVTGETSAAKTFADAWTALTNSESILRTSTRLYRLDHLRFPEEVHGIATTASPDDIPLLERWFADFSAEATPDKPTDDIAAVVKRRIQRKEIVLWAVNDNPVSLAGRSAIVDGVARIGPVFTPSQYRRQGYGAAVTAAATQISLDNGATDVVLYTDLDYPTSNAIYQSIGYVPHHDGLEIHFDVQKLETEI